MNTHELRQQLRSLSDADYAVFQRKLIPTVSPDTIIGVRTPQLRLKARQMLKAGGYEAFLLELPHPTFDENQLHAFIISGMRDADECLRLTEAFLPYVDNWATCDQLSPRILGKHREALLASILRWLQSDHEYTVRFAIGMLMSHFLDDAFQPEHLRLVADVRRHEYYIRMMQAWYFATALAKQYEATLPSIRLRWLDPWTHNKTIQKAIESRRITDEQKACLKTLRIR